MMRRAALPVAVAAAVSLVPVAVAGAAESAVVSAGFQFLPPEVVVDQGGSLTHVNVDLAGHNVVSTETGADGSPLFSSGNPAGIGAYDVAGVENLPARETSYPFICTLHPQMQGGVRVLEQSAPVPAPDPGSAPLPVATVPTPSSLTVHEGGLYVASYGTGTVFELAIGTAGTLGAPQPYAEGFSSPLGVEFAPDGTMFVSDSHPSTRPGRSTDGRVWAVAPDGSKSIVVDELPNGRHNTNGMAVHGDRLYIANGNSTDDGISGGEPEEPLSGTLISVPLTARDLTPASAEIAVEARGMRNIYDVAFRPGTEEAWIPMNGPDPFDPYGEDLLLKADLTRPEVTEGEVTPYVPPDFGFPGCIYAAPPNEPRFKQNPNTVGVFDCDPNHRAPEQLLGLHVSANGLEFGPDDSFWDGDLFIAEFGNFFGDRPVGHQVVRVPIEPDGSSGPPQTFLPEAAPLDLTFGPDGMYVGDFATGQIQLVRGL
jgi:glucose/arabinose dehydrogenase/plastocyanin